MRRLPDGTYMYDEDPPWADKLALVILFVLKTLMIIATIALPIIPIIIADIDVFSLDFWKGLWRASPHHWLILSLFALSIWKTSQFIYSVWRKKRKALDD